MGAHATYLQTIGAPISGLESAPAQGLLGGWGQSADDVAARLLTAVRQGRMEDATGEALDAEARTRGFFRVRGEGDEALRAWLRGTFGYYREMGSDEGVVRQVKRLGYTSVTVHSALSLYSAGWIGAFGLTPGLLGPIGSFPNFFFVELDLTNGFGVTADWDGAIDWDGSAVWDLVEPYTGAIADLRETIWRWKPFGASCRYVSVRVGAFWFSIPVAERWEWDSAGNVTGPYLQSFMVP